MTDDKPLSELTDDELAAEHESAVKRLEELEDMARASMVGLPRPEYNERLHLMSRHARIEIELAHRRDLRPLEVATAFHAEADSGVTAREIESTLKFMDAVRSRDALQVQAAVQTLDQRTLLALDSVMPWLMGMVASRLSFVVEELARHEARVETEGTDG